MKGPFIAEVTRTHTQMPSPSRKIIAMYSLGVQALRWSDEHIIHSRSRLTLCYRVRFWALLLDRVRAYTVSCLVACETDRLVQVVRRLPCGRSGGEAAGSVSGRQQQLAFNK